MNQRIRVLLHHAFFASLCFLAFPCLLASAPLAPPLELMASQAIHDAEGEVLPGNHPKAAAFGYAHVPGCRVQVIGVGENGRVDPPRPDGQPGGDDVLFYRTAIGEGMPPNQQQTGRFSVSIHPPPDTGSRLFVRVFSHASEALATHWADSEVFTFESLMVMDVSELGLRATTLSRAKGSR